MGSDSYRRANLRLQRALRSETGHVVVIAPDRATACTEARRGLISAEAAAVLYVSAARTAKPWPGRGASQSPARDQLDLRALLVPLLERARAVGKPAFILVEDADGVDAEDLERVRVAVECIPEAVKWLRIVLAGDERLGRTLDQPAARALASNVCVRVRVPREPAADPRTVAARSPSADVAALSALSLAFIALMVLPYLPSTSVGPEMPLPAAAPRVSAAVTEPFDRDAAEVVTAAFTADAQPPSADVMMCRGVDAHTDSESGSEAPAPFDLSDQRHQDRRVERPVSEPQALRVQAPEGSASVMVSEVALAEDKGPVARPRPDDILTTEPREPLARHVVIQAGVFEDAASANAARLELAERLENVVVARVDGPDGPLYSVRIVGLLSTAEVATAHDVLHELGYDPERYEQPTTISRFSRRLRPLWASLF